jgi:hypothetical protein
MMEFTPNLVVGIVTTLMGVVLLLDRLGLVEASSLLAYWPVALILFGLSLVVQAFHPGAAAAAGPRQRPIISPGFVIFMVLVWLFASNTPVFKNVRAGDTAEDTMSLVGVMSQHVQVSEARPFRSATMTSVMGSSRLDLRQAILAPGEVATIEVFGLMGRVQVDVPRDWVVDIQATAVMGGVQDRGVEVVRGPGRRGSRFVVPDSVLTEPDAASQSDAVTPGTADAAPATASEVTGTAVTDSAVTAPPRLIIRGVVMMGGLVIRS